MIALVMVYTFGLSTQQTIFDGFIFEPVASNCSLLDKIKVGIPRSHICSQSGVKMTKGKDIFGIFQYCAEEVECDENKYLSPDGDCSYSFDFCFEKKDDIMPRNLLQRRGNCTTVPPLTEKPMDPSMASTKTEKIDYGLANGTHVIHESLPVTFMPLSNQTYVQFGTIGPITGNREYCDAISILMHCHKGRAIPNHRYRASTTIRSQPVVWINGCYEPVRSIQMIDTAVPVVEESPKKLGPDNLQVACLKEQIIIQSSKYPIMVKTCGKSRCKSHKLESSPLSIHRTLFSKLWDEKIRIFAWDPSSNSRVDKVAYCDNFNNCTWCYARLVNPSCYSSLQVIVLIFFTYGLIFTAIGMEYTYHNICQPIIYLRNMFRKSRCKHSNVNDDKDSSGDETRQPFLSDDISQTTEQMEMDEMPNSRKPTTPFRPKTAPVPKKRGSIILTPMTMLMLAGGYALKCDVNHEIGLIGQSCNTELVCNPWTMVPFKLDHSYDTHCSSISSGSEISEVLQVELLSLVDVCNKDHLYWTRNVQYITDHVVHCPSSAYYKKEWCLEVDDNSRPPGKKKMCCIIRAKIECYC